MPRIAVKSAFTETQKGAVVCNAFRFRGLQSFCVHSAPTQSTHATDDLRVASPPSKKLRPLADPPASCACRRGRPDAAGPSQHAAGGGASRIGGRRLSRVPSTCLPGRHLPGSPQDAGCLLWSAGPHVPTLPPPARSTRNAARSLAYVEGPSRHVLAGVLSFHCVLTSTATLPLDDRIYMDSRSLTMLRVVEPSSARANQDLKEGSPPIPATHDWHGQHCLTSSVPTAAPLPAAACQHTTRSFNAAVICE